VENIGKVIHRVKKSGSLCGGGSWLRRSSRVGWIGCAGKNGSAESDGVSEVQVVESKWVTDEPRERIGSMHTYNDYMIRSESGTTIGDTGGSQMSRSSVSGPSGKITWIRGGTTNLYGGNIQEAIGNRSKRSCTYFEQSYSPVLQLIFSELFNLNTLFCDQWNILQGQEPHEISLINIENG
ncbi:hypothetical protein Tco_1137564, partial [Tanacetum coccineum]